ncbi:MAG: TolC family protein [Vicinamibacterales bacterium]
MKLSRWWMLVVAILIVRVPAPASAQVVVPLSLDAALERAVASSPRLAESRAREAAASAAVTARLALGRPTLTAMSSVLRTNHVEAFGIPQSDGRIRVIFPDIPTNYRARAEMLLPLFTSGRFGALVRAARGDERAAGAESRAALADLELEVTTAYWTFVTAKQRADVLEHALQRADAALGDVRARVETGVLPPNELSSAQAQRGRQNVQLIQVRNEASLAEAQLRRLVGAAPADVITPSSPIESSMPGASALESQPASALLARAIQVRPERQALAERERALRSAADAARASSRPQVGAVAAVEPARPNQRFVPRADRWNTSWDLGVNVSWSLWDSGRSRAEVAVSSAQADALRARIADFDASIAVEVQQRLLDLASSREAVEASAEVVTAATEAARVLRERFAVGVATSTEVLDADLTLLEAELERTRLMSAVRLGEARLARTVGRPPS